MASVWCLRYFCCSGGVLGKGCLVQMNISNISLGYRISLSDIATTRSSEIFVSLLFFYNLTLFERSRQSSLFIEGKSIIGVFEAPKNPQAIRPIVVFIKNMPLSRWYCLSDTFESQLERNHWQLYVSLKQFRLPWEL